MKTIVNSLSVVPFEPLQRAVALSIADVTTKINSGKKVAENAYATSFFINFFGKRNPSKSEVNSIFTGIVSVKEKTILINNFIQCNGSFYRNVDMTFAAKAFPSLKNLIDFRVNSHSDLKIEQEGKIKAKADIKTTERKLILFDNLLVLSSKDLGAWVSETDYELFNYEQVEYLESWFKANKQDSDYSFHELYCRMNASEIANDLSFD